MAEPQQQPEGITGYILHGILTSFLPWIHLAPSVSGWKRSLLHLIKSLRFSGRRFPRGASRPHTCGRDRRQVRTVPVGHLGRKTVPQVRATCNASKTKLQLPCFMYKWCIYIFHEFSKSAPQFVQKTLNFYNNFKKNPWGSGLVFVQLK